MARVFVGGERQLLSIQLENTLGAAQDPATEGTLEDILVLIDSIEEKTPDLTGTYKYYTGGSGVADVQPGERVIGISCIAGAVGNGTVTVTGMGPITVPSTRTLSLDPKGQLVGTDITFSGTVSFVVEVLV